MKELPMKRTWTCGRGRLRRSPARAQRGLTMVEVLVSIVVLAIGLLGLAGLQANGIKINQGSTYRWKATQLAADLADQLRADKTALAAAGAGLSCVISASGALTGTCPGGLLATNLPNWAASQLAMLPGASATFAPNAAGVWEVDIGWDDSRAAQAAPGVAVAPAACGALPTPTTGCFSLVTRI
ncbi:MAG TPA: type IV pilus modification protein PilV [Burkholderiaceae bacterium]|nr:type IV pilus modification protein PilV [Burkholderiaceae bacterium]